MITVEQSGLDRAIDALKKQSQALRDLTPAYKRFAADIVKKTDDAFHNSHGYDGEAFEPLSPYTIENRVGNLKAANKRTKKGELTKGAKALREKLLAPGGIKPLVDTARARNSVHADAGKDGVDWSAVGYLGVHMAGTDKAGRGRNVTIPVRNVSPFILDGGKWKLRDSAKKQLGARIREHVFGSSAK